MHSALAGPRSANEHGVRVATLPQWAPTGRLLLHRDLPINSPSVQSHCLGVGASCSAALPLVVSLPSCQISTSFRSKCINYRELQTLVVCDTANFNINPKPSKYRARFVDTNTNTCKGSLYREKQCAMIYEMYHQFGNSLHILMTAWSVRFSFPTIISWYNKTHLSAFRLF